MFLLCYTNQVFMRLEQQRQELRAALELGLQDIEAGRTISLAELKIKR